MKVIVMMCTLWVLHLDSNNSHSNQWTPNPHHQYLNSQEKATPSKHTTRKEYALINFLVSFLNINLQYRMDVVNKKMGFSLIQIERHFKSRSVTTEILTSIMQTSGMASEKWIPSVISIYCWESFRSWPIHCMCLISLWLQRHNPVW